MKQVLTILFAVVLFDITITPLNLGGIVLTLIGGAYYAAVEYRQKTSANNQLGRCGSNYQSGGAVQNRMNWSAKAKARGEVAGGKGSSGTGLIGLGLTPLPSNTVPL